MKKSIALTVISIANSKTLKYHTFLMKHQFFLLFAISMKVAMKKYLKKKKQLRY